jgi:hypothetical protein
MREYGCLKSVLKKSVILFKKSTRVVLKIKYKSLIY